MASSVARCARSPENSPSFCLKIVTDDDLRDGKLESRGLSNSSKSSGNAHQDVLPTHISFKSDQPLVMIKMTAYYLQSGSQMFINASFATKHLCRVGASCDLTLQTPDERTWIPELIVYETTEARVSAKVKGAGWTSFKVDNRFKEGDVCVLELIEECKFRVSLYRAREKINQPRSEDKLEGKHNSAKKKPSSSNF
ncbi:B3 domain-containing protein Os01g0723500-like [Argentina anserina]|uniref:B3 domain-containing protein Os01g0723500-like n=1 Tax=Argentina anserina TaxID=57926 RepID=UPI0021766F39|nr:B3 domain-containing protein Os01g0723500-like [Potentilla anserina]